MCESLQQCERRKKQFSYVLLLLWCPPSLAFCLTVCFLGGRTEAPDVLERRFLTLNCQANGVKRRSRRCTPRGCKSNTDHSVEGWHVLKQTLTAEKVPAPSFQPGTWREKQKKKENHPPPSNPVCVMTWGLWLRVDRMWITISGFLDKAALNKGSLYWQANEPSLKGRGG